MAENQPQNRRYTVSEEVCYERHSNEHFRGNPHYGDCFGAVPRRTQVAEKNLRAALGFGVGPAFNTVFRSGLRSGEP
jgi:hypothetical protein